MFNFLRLASGLIVLPLLVKQLSGEELGMYFVFLSLTALIPIIDFGFNPAIGRFVTYAMAGAATLKSHGIHPTERPSSGPNFRLLWRLLRTTRQLYGGLALTGFVLVGLWGTYLVWIKVHECADPAHVWIAWGLTLTALTVELYSSWWNTFLYNTNEVLSSARISFGAQTFRILLSIVLLLAGAKLYSVPLAALAGTLTNRILARRACLKVLGPRPSDLHAETQNLVALLWPNTWRAGVHYVSNYLRVNANTAICASAFGLATTAEYGLSVQVMFIALGMASVWTQVKWPAVGQFRTKNDYLGLQRMMRPRFLLQFTTFVVLAGGAILILPALLAGFDPDKKMLPLALLLLLGVNAFLELGFTFWTTLISSENRLPYLWPTVITNVTSLALCLTLVHATGFGVASLVLAPLAAGLLFNYWYWAFAGARSMRTTLPRFLLGRYS
jgi:O-antigen/teichoic acid export membrane protein